MTRWGGVDQLAGTRSLGALFLPTDSARFVRARDQPIFRHHRHDVYYDDHPPPHFHVRYGEHRAILEIDPVAVLAGTLPPRALGLVSEWAALHREALKENWERAREQAPLKPIAPLE